MLVPVACVDGSGGRVDNGSTYHRQDSFVALCDLSARCERDSDYCYQIVRLRRSSLRNSLVGRHEISSHESPKVGYL